MGFKKNIFLVLIVLSFVTCNNKTDKEYLNIIRGTWEWKEPWPYTFEERMTFYDNGTYSKYEWEVDNKKWTTLYDSSDFEILERVLYLKDITNTNFNAYKIRKMTKNTLKIENVNTGGRKTWKKKD